MIISFISFVECSLLWSQATESNFLSQIKCYYTGDMHFGNYAVAGVQYKNDQIMKYIPQGTKTTYNLGKVTKNEGKRGGTTCDN